MRCDLGKRHQYERPIRQSRVRNFRRTRLNARIVVDQIDVERARRILSFTFAPETFLEPM